ncbi:MAG: type III-A CRISPR-associated protein Csm2 [Thermodesulforhabdaceae bacterium]
MASLWKELWKDEKTNLVNPEAFSKIAEEWAKKISGEDQNQRKNKTSQLRKFYDEIFKLNQRARAQESNWDEILPYVHLVIAKAAYAKGRGLVTDSFVNELKEMLSNVKTREHLHAVTTFLEAFMAFYKQYRPRD